MTTTFNVARIACSEPTLCPASPVDLVGAAEAWASEYAVVEQARMHPLVGAVHRAFATHLPLVLSPDHIWLTLAQGLSLHVEARADELRSRFVLPHASDTVEVRDDSLVMGSAQNNWAPVIIRLAGELSNRVVAKRAELVRCDFSSSSPISRTVSSIVLMDVMKRYFKYRVMTLCGIPSITLLGNTEDWESVRARAAMLTEFDLQWWTSRLLPLLDEFVRASKGQIDNGFWNSIYKHENASGGSWVTGWINLLFPYLEGPERHDRMNPALRHPGARVNTADFPRGLVDVPFQWEYLGQEHGMLLSAGFAGVGLDQERLAVAPALAWAVREAGPEPVLRVSGAWEIDGEVKVCNEQVAELPLIRSQERRVLRIASPGDSEFLSDLVWFFEIEIWRREDLQEHAQSDCKFVARFHEGGETFTDIECDAFEFENAIR